MKPKAPPVPEAPPPVVTESDISADDEATIYQKKRARGFNYSKTLLSDKPSEGSNEKKSILG